MQTLGQAYTLFACASALFTIGFSLYSLHAAGCLLGRRPAAGKGRKDLPPITLLKPVKGVDREMYANLASFLDQDYPRFQVVFCVQDPRDPALAVLRRLRRDFCERVDIETVVSDGCIGCNPKINNLSNAAALIRHDLILIADSDVRVERDFLRGLVRVFDDPGVGLATCFYQSRCPSGLGALLEALSVNTHFLPQTLAAVRGGLRFAMGAVMFVRRSAFEQIGGFLTMGKHLADDYVLGAAVQARGWRVEVVGPVVSSIPDDGSVAEHLRHLARWSSTIRLCRPAGYLGSGILHGFTFLLLDSLFQGAAPWKLELLALTAAVRVWTVGRIHCAYTGNPEILRQLPLLPLADVIQCCAWIAGLRPGRVHWRGAAYSVRGNGRLDSSPTASERRREAAVITA
ncbi:MAG: bacteriohopanetetrol glucosamine biosynthesis glycosyltransferase HpnI [Elusimicrobiota bacterium]